MNELDNYCSYSFKIVVYKRNAGKYYHRWFLVNTIYKEFSQWRKMLIICVGYRIENGLFLLAVVHIQ